MMQFAALSPSLAAPVHNVFMACVHLVLFRAKKKKTEQTAMVMSEK